MPPLKKTPKIHINADMIKIVTASYFRYRLKYLYTCTEYESCDIFTSNGNYTTEIEVKISYSDLKADAKKTKTYGKLKHDYYSGTHKSKYVNVPNYFYFAITYDMFLDGKSVQYIMDTYKDYGIMYIKDWREPIIIKRPTMLHKNKVSQNELSAILKRISSENICLRKKLYELKLKVSKLS